MTQKKAAFIRIGSFSNANESVLLELKNNFQDIEFEDIDLFPLIFKTDIINIFSIIKEYKLRAISNGIKSVKKFYANTPYIYFKAKDIVQKKVDFNKYIFTFQTQSLFDFSSPGTPHFLYTDHTHLENLRYPSYNKQNLSSQKWIQCEREIYKNAYMNFTMSKNINNSLINDYNCDVSNIECVYCGSNIEIDSNRTSNLNNYYSNKNILFVGIDWERKGGPTLVKAFEKVLLDHPDATLTIVGCSPQIKIPNVNIIGKIPLKEVAQYYKLASVFALPTQLEPFGIVFLEAMANKLPIIGTNIGAIPDFITENKNGHIVEPNNPEQLSKRIIDLLDNPDKCRSFGEVSFEIFSKNYNWKNVGLKMSKKIKEIIA